MEPSKQVEVVADTAVFMLTRSIPSLTETDAINLLKDRLQKMAMKSSSDTEKNRSSSKTIAKTSAGATKDCKHTGSQSNQGRTPVAGVPRMVPKPFSFDILRLPQDVIDGRLIQAAKDGAVKEMQELLAVGADTEATDRSGYRRTALHWAADRGHVEAVRCLVDNGAPMYATDCKRNTPLHLAASNGHAAVVWLLVASSVNPNITGENRMTPLHCATVHGHAEVVAVLLEAGAKRSLEDKWGKTPVDIATENNQKELIDMLTRN